MSRDDDTRHHRGSYYAATANPAPRHAPLAGDADADVCVVGGGFTGVSAALHLAERGYRVVLLEAARIGWGASGRNGGQVGTGLRRDMREVERMLGEARARVLWDLGEEAKGIIHERIARHRIDCDYRPGNLYAATRDRYLPDMAAEAEHLAARYGYDRCEVLDARAMREAVASRCYRGGVLDRGGGHLHPLNFVLGMAAAAAAAGAAFHEGSRVVDVEPGSRAKVRTAAGAVRADHVLLCTNAYLERLEPRIASRAMPIVNHVLATEPLGEERALALIRPDCCVHASKFVVDYFRLSADRRLLFGGGETYSDREPPDLAAYVRRYMLGVFPQLADVRVDYAWSGRLAITVSRLPHVGRLPGNVWFAQGFSGHGVALTQIVGKLMAEAVAGTAERFDAFASLRHLPFPGGRPARRALLVAAMLYGRLRDML